MGSGTGGEGGGWGGGGVDRKSDIIYFVVFFVGLLGLR